MKLLSVLIALVLLVTSPLVFAAGPADFLGAVEVVMQSYPSWLTALTTVVTAATAITSVTPSRTDDKIVDMILRVLNVLSGNVGRNRNADDVDRR